jgi:hypothetical protein
MIQFTELQGNSRPFSRWRYRNAPSFLFQLTDLKIECANGERTFQKI